MIHFYSFLKKVCSFPLEYCEFGSSLTRCKEWLKAERPDEFDKYYSDGKLLPFPPSVSFVLDKGYPSRGIYFLENNRPKTDILFLSLEALQAKIGTLSLDAQTKLEKEALKKEAKADAKADAALKKKLSSQVRICPTSSNLQVLTTPNTAGNNQAH